MDAGNRHLDLSARTLITTRILEAPRELVFDAFTAPEHLVQWWGPDGFSLTTHSFDMRVGGEWRFMMHGPDGRDYPNCVAFTEIVRPERLSWRHGDDVEVRFENTATFEDLGGRTRLTLTAVFPSAAERDRVVREFKADEGGRQTLGRLAEYLDANLFTITRTLEAPRDLVWKMWTDVGHLAKWWGPKGFTWLRGSLDLKPGGRFHYGLRNANGQEMWGRFVYHVVTPPERLEYVSSFSDSEGNAIHGPFFADWPLETYNVVTFTEEGGRTRITLRGAPLNASQAERERFRTMKPSMTQGFSASFEQLEAYVAQTRT